MKSFLILVVVMFAASSATAQGNPFKQLEDRIEQVNDEDQRLVDGTLSGDTLTLYTQDMVAGKDGDIARRAVVVTGFDGLRGVNGVNGINGIDGKDANNAYVNSRIDTAMRQTRYLERNMSAGVAAAMAIGQHQFDPSFKGGQVGLSGGFYNGENAVSLGVGVPLGERAFFSASIATDSGSYGESGSVGVTLQLP